LSITNDGASPGGSGGGGSGLAGLAERLAPFGGSLHHGPSGRSAYRLLVHLPLTHRPNEASR